jgi:hypothetical protein
MSGLGLYVAFEVGEYHGKVAASDRIFSNGNWRLASCMTNDHGELVLFDHSILSTHRVFIASTKLRNVVVYASCLHTY